jgi:hypothetical protein
MRQITTAVRVALVRHKKNITRLFALILVMLAAGVVYVTYQNHQTAKKEELDSVKREVAHFSMLADSDLTPEQASLRFQAEYGSKPDEYNPPKSGADSERTYRQVQLLIVAGKYSKALSVLTAYGTTIDRDKDYQYQTTVSLIAEHAQDEVAFKAAEEKLKTIRASSPEMNLESGKQGPAL